jgi:cellulose synthase operon protein C
MPAPAKHLSPAELAALEHAFAADPSSEAYRPLTEAYLGMGRFMEAMVVCKKGVKAHPTDPAPRLLLARIYAAQGKKRKAAEELEGALQVKPGDVAANRMLGVLQLELGEKLPGEAALRRAYAAAPSDAETLDAMKKWGVVVAAAPNATSAATSTSTPAATTSPVAPSTAPSTPTEDAPRSDPSALSEAPPEAARSRRASIPAATPSAEAPPVLEPVAAPASPPSSAARAASRGAPTARNASYADELAERYSTREYLLEREVPARRRRSRAPIVATLALGLVLVAVLVGWAIVGSIRRSRAVEIDRGLKEARELIEKDSYASYKKAAQVCEKILGLDPDALGSHAYLAYIDAIRWGEHGESEGLREDARKHLDAVAKLRRPHSYAYAAEVYLQFHGGDARGAVERVKTLLAGPEGASALLRGAAGVIEMQAGDLDAARDDLTFARNTAPTDVRITQMLAEQWRRRGQGYEVQANALFDTALTRLAPDHVPSLLGKAQLLLDAGRPGEAAKRVERVLDLGPNASPRQVALAHALRGSVLHAEGKAAEADREEQEALALDPQNPDIYDLVGRRKLRGGDGAGAIEAFNRALQLDPARVGFYVDLAGALMSRPGGAKQAVAALEKASARLGNARVEKLLGDAYRADGDLERARGAYEKAIGMEKRYPEARIALARVWRDRADWRKALDELDRAVKEYGESATGGAALAWDEIAELEEARGSPPDAVERAYTAALKAEPTNCPALFWLGRSRSERKGRTYDPSLAKQMLSDYLRLCPRAPRAADAQRILSAMR